jgi:hypothetical protein
MKLWIVKRRRRGAPQPGEGLSKAGVALMGVGFAFAWAMQKIGPPDPEPRPELAAPILAGVALLFAGAIVHRWRMGPSKTWNGRRLRGAGTGPQPEPVRGWRRLGVALLALGVGALAFLAARGDGAFGAWMMSGAAALAGAAILVRLRMTAAPRT